MATKAMNGFGRSAAYAGGGALIAALDIGASKVACFIARAEYGGDEALSVDVVGVGHHVHAAGSRSAGDGLIEIGATDRAIRAALDSAERMSGERVRRVYAALGGRYLRCRRLRVDLELDGHMVTEDDVGAAVSHGASAAVEEGWTSLHSAPVLFSVDGAGGVRDPRGLAAETLGAELLSVTARTSAVRNLTACAQGSHVDLTAVAPGPYAAALATLVDDEKELGVLCLDMGARTTGLAVMERGALVHCSGVPLGGAHVTADIARILGVPIAEAERLKTLYGSAICAGDDAITVDAPQLGETGERVRASRGEIAAVIAPRLEETFEHVRDQVAAAGLNRGVVRRVVLTGGASQLPGAIQTAERILGMSARLGRPLVLAGAPAAAGGPAFSVCAGIVLHAARERVEGGAIQQRRRRARRTSTGGFGRVGEWLRERF